MGCSGAYSVGSDRLGTLVTSELRRRDRSACARQTHGARMPLAATQGLPSKTALFWAQLSRKGASLTAVGKT